MHLIARKCNIEKQFNNLTIIISTLSSKIPETFPYFTQKTFINPLEI